MENSKSKGSPSEPKQECTRRPNRSQTRGRESGKAGDWQVLTWIKRRSSKLELSESIPLSRSRRELAVGPRSKAQRLLLAFLPLPEKRSAGGGWAKCSSADLCAHSIPAEKSKNETEPRNAIFIEKRVSGSHVCVAVPHVRNPFFVAAPTKFSPRPKPLHLCSPLSRARALLSTPTSTRTRKPKGSLFLYSCFRSESIGHFQSPTPARSQGKRTAKKK